MIKKLFENQKPLMIAGSLFFALFIILTIISMFDSQEVMGINRWIKPMKFSISLTIYLWTLAIYLFFINGKERAKKNIAHGAIAMMVGEIVLIILQAWRGTTSHFNIATLFDGMIFQAMGLMIAVNTILIIYLLVLYFRVQIDLPESIIWGMRFGIILLLLASAEGGLMSAMLRHNVGVADGGAGLPIVNWSTKGGDLRVAHFVGMHAFQAVPFFAFTLEKYKIKSATAWTFVFAAVYFAIFTGIFVQAMLGKPLLAGF